uniref:Uncharacterized protein n=1 Tax=Phaeocystis antarctica TaxID=33657 RepID=A0A7S0HR55_9EUKA
MLACAIASLALLRAPPLRADGQRVARSAIHMATSAEPKKASAFGTFMASKSMKMTTIKKGAKPKLRGKRLPPSMLELTGKFKKQYAKQDLEVLWAAMLKIYGSQQLAEQAARDNPQILNPSYSFCNTMLASADVLNNMMSKEEALEVMTNNPAVLQCGPSLDTLGPDEIKGFASIRALGNKIPESARNFLLIATLLFTLFPVAAQNNPALQDSWLLSLSKPLVGTLFAVLIEGSRIVIVGSIIKSSVGGSEQEKEAIEKAKQSERRRMGKA